MEILAAGLSTLGPINDRTIKRLPHKNEGEIMSKSRSLPTPKSAKVRLDQIQADPISFQPREGGIDHGHVATLTKVLENGNPLDPIKLRRNDESGYTVLDGHHSFEAYQRSGWSNPVPALVYECTVEQGQLVSMEDNAKARLQMTAHDRKDWAWRLTCNQRELSIQKVATLCAIGTATVSRMRAVRNDLEKGDVHLPENWRAARIAHTGHDPCEWTQDMRDEWREEAFEKLKQKIAAPLAVYGRSNPDLVLEVVHEVMGQDRFRLGAECLGFFEGEIDEYTGEFTRADSSTNTSEDNAF